QDQQIDVFTHLHGERQVELVEVIPPQVRKRLLNELSVDDRVDFLGSLSDEVAQPFIGELTPQERLYTLALMRCPEDSAGRMMTPEFISLRPHDRVSDALRVVRQEAHRVETIYVAYVVDEESKLVGTVSLRDLLSADLGDEVDHIMTVDPIHAYVNTDREELAKLVSRYDLLAVPVTSADNRLVGIVTYDDVDDVIREEASEDILRMHGVGTASDDYFNAKIGVKLRQRFTVLASLALVSILSVLLQQVYNDLVAQVSILAIYVTLLNGSSGNCGTQMAGIIIRAQSLQAFASKRFAKLLMREIIVGIMMALLMALAVAGLVYLQNPSLESLGGNSVGVVSFTVGVAMFAALSTTNILGGLIPVAMKKLKLDPALTAGPFITTAA
ncbi:MAG: magnesium transporter, partial [Planctomycetes bacterium]|nr:magnesium transporter [Planctomycetota bacterium]